MLNSCALLMFRKLQMTIFEIGMYIVQGHPMKTELGLIPDIPCIF